MSNKSRQQIKQEEREENYKCRRFPLFTIFNWDSTHVNEGGKRFSPKVTKKGLGASWVCGHFIFKTMSHVEQSNLDLELLNFLPLPFKCGDYCNVSPRLV